MKRYERYKNSGEYWLGEIPESWNNIRLRLISTITKGKKPTKDYEKFEEGLYPYLSMEYLRGKSDNPTFANPKEGNLLVVEEGDILILWDGSNAGEIVQAKEGILSSTMARIVLESELFNSFYLNYYLQLAQQYIKNHNIGMGIPHVNGNILRDLLLIVPTLKEQHQIADFLDHKTALIDEVIAKKERLIELLKAKREATINEVVTGKKVWNNQSKTWEVPTNVKDSGVEWLGEIPEEYSIIRLRFLGNCQNGVSAGGDYFGSGDPFISYSDVYNNDELPQKTNGLANSSKADKENYSVKEGDVFFTRTSETIEEIGIASTCFNTIENAVFAGFLIRFRPKQELLWKGFSKYFFRSFIPRVHFVKEMNLVTRASLSQELLKSLPVVLPSLQTQKLIYEFLEEKNIIFRELESKLQTQIQQLKSYRQSLISEAVTGKIDVREFFNK